MSEPLYTPRPRPTDEADPRESTEPSGRGLALAALAALAVAIAGGVLWGYVVKWSDYEVGIIAWGIGFAAGTAVVFASGGRRGVPLQAIAIVSALIGILLGKYLSFALVVLEDAERLGIDIGVFSTEMRDIFRESLSDVFGAFDLLWVGLAVFSAWRIPRPEPVEPAPQQLPPAAPTRPPDESAP